MRTRRTTLVVVGLVLAFLAPMSTAYALWSRTATASLGVSVAAAPVASVSYYLENPGTGNTTSSTHLDLVTTAPTLGSLPNYDTNRDSFAGLYLAKGTGLSESDNTKNQRWSVPGPVVANAPVKLRLWSAVKDFDTSKRSAVVAGLYNCAPNNNFAGCTELAQVTVSTTGSWSGGSNTWVQKEWDFGTLNLNLAANRRLYVKLVATGEDMWFAYDTAAYPSALVIG